MLFTPSALVLLLAPLLAPAMPAARAFEDISASSHELSRRQSYKRKPICPKKGVHMIVGSGAGGSQVRGYGLLNTTITAIKVAVPGSSNFSVPFVKTSDQSIENQAVINGTILMTENIEWYAKGCPNTPIVLVGYSEGGMVTMDTLCGRSRYDNQPYGVPLNSSYTKNIIAVALYGEETRVPGQPYNTGTCITGRGEFQRRNPASCAPFAPVIKSWCDINDPLCCQGSPRPNQSIHYTYPATYNSDVASFVQQQYQTWLAMGVSSSSSSSATMASTSTTLSSSTSSSATDSITSTSSSTDSATATSSSSSSFTSSSVTSIPT